MPAILFVCTANIVRSPVAEALFKRLLLEHAREVNASDWVVASAGTWARRNDLASSVMHKLLAERGIDLSAHRSRSLTADLLEAFDLVLVMEYGQKEALQIEFPACARRVYMLSELVGLTYNIEDPIGRGEEKYRETLQEIDELLKDGFQRILELINNKRG